MTLVESTPLAPSLAALGHVSRQVTDSQLDARTPCTEWTVAQVLLHAAGDQRGWAATIGTAELPAFDPFQPPTSITGGVDTEVATAVRVATEVWGSVPPETDELPTPLPPVPTMPAGLAAGAAALDAAIHAWDVATATGQPSPLSDDLALLLRPAAEATADQLRGFAYAEPLSPEPADSAADALLRYLGRDPSWSRP